MKMVRIDDANNKFVFAYLYWEIMTNGRDRNILVGRLYDTDQNISGKAKTYVFRNYDEPEIKTSRKSADRLCL